MLLVVYETGIVKKTNQLRKGSRQAVIVYLSNYVVTYVFMPGKFSMTLPRLASENT